MRYYGYYEGTLQLMHVVASQPSVTVVSEYPHSTLNGTATRSSHTVLRNKRPT